MSMEHELTHNVIRRLTGFSLAVYFPRWQTDGAGIIEFHEELDRLEKDLGTENVIGSLYVDEGQLILGVFIKRDRIIDAEVVRRELPVAPPRELT